LRPGKVYPRLVGYCNVAVVEECGADVHGIAVGDRILTHQSHRSAFVCEVGLILAHIPEEMTSSDASVTYLFHLGYNALLKADFRPGQEVAVIGLGVVGMSAVGLTLALGGAVTGFSDLPEQRDRAVRIGARGTWGKRSTEGVEAFHKATGGARLVITTSNNWDDWRMALQLAATDATICVIGFPGRGESAPSFNPLDSQYFYDKQLKLIACGKPPESPPTDDPERFDVKRGCRFIMDLIRQGKLPTAELVGDLSPAEFLPRIYERLATRELGERIEILDWRTS